MLCRVTAHPSRGAAPSARDRAVPVRRCCSGRHVSGIQRELLTRVRPRKRLGPMVRRALLLGLMFGALVGCGSDDESESVRYSVTFINRTSAAYDVWMSVDSDELGFRD